MKRIPSQLWVFLLCGTVPLVLLGYYMVTIFPQLPERVAVHFDWQGHPNGWMVRDRYYLFLAVFIGGINLLLSLAQWLPESVHQFPFRNANLTHPIVKAEMTTRRGLGILIGMILVNWIALAAFHLTVSQSIPHVTPFFPLSVGLFLVFCGGGILVFLIWFYRFTRFPHGRQKV